MEKYDKLKYLTLACASSGKSCMQCQNLPTSKSINKNKCKEKTTATFFCRRKYRVTIVILEQNDGLTTGKVRHHKSNKNEFLHERRLELND